MVSIIRLAAGEGTNLSTVCKFAKHPKTGLPEWSSETNDKPFRICRQVYDFSKEMNIYEEFSCYSEQFCFTKRNIIKILDAYDNGKKCAGLRRPDEAKLPQCTMSAKISALDS